MAHNQNMPPSWRLINSASGFVKRQVEDPAVQAAPQFLQLLSCFRARSGQGHRQAQVGQVVRDYRPHPDVIFHDEQVDAPGDKPAQVEYV